VVLEQDLFLEKEVFNPKAIEYTEEFNGICKENCNICNSCKTDKIFANIQNPDERQEAEKLREDAIKFINTYFVANVKHMPGTNIVTKARTRLSLTSLGKEYPAYTTIFNHLTYYPHMIVASVSETVELPYR